MPVSWDGGEGNSGKYRRGVDGRLATPYTDSHSRINFLRH